MGKRSVKALFAATGVKEELDEFEKALKELGAEGVMSNEASRLLQLRWIIIYADYDEGNKADIKFLYAYRATNCKHTSKPKVLKIKTVLARLKIALKK